MRRDGDNMGNRLTGWEGCPIALMPRSGVSKAKGLNHILRTAEPGVGIGVPGMTVERARMLWNLDVSWLMMAVATVAVLSYFFGAALHWLRREDGFGAFGNAIIISGSFFLSIMFANQQGYNLRDLHIAVVVGLFGAFVVLASLTLIRGLIARM
jgi:hypothetical protein